MATMNISLTTELEQFVVSRVKSGHYHTSSEVMRAALRLMIEQEKLRELRMDELRKQVNVGLDELDDGKGIPAEKAYAELDRRRAARIAKR